MEQRIKYKIGNNHPPYKIVIPPEITDAIYASKLTTWTNWTHNNKRLTDEALLLPDGELTDEHKKALDQSELFSLYYVNYREHKHRPPEVLNAQHLRFQNLVSNLGVPEDKFIEHVNLAEDSDSLAILDNVVASVPAYESALQTVAFKDNEDANYGSYVQRQRLTSSLENRCFFTRKAGYAGIVTELMSHLNRHIILPPSKTHCFSIYVHTYFISLFLNINASKFSLRCKSHCANNLSGISADCAVWP
ncbi:hypothetical protein M3Y98_00867400 [Aphelenchoides besseyi]|nr:hypothetical protein M3Y98_00867400 [Aphelenchoides besseyi]